MACKTFQAENIGAVTVYKRRGTRTMRLTIRSDGSLRVTIPAWMNYGSGLQFALSRQDWVAKHAKPAIEPLMHNQPIGKAHRLLFITSNGAGKVSTRISGNEVRITIPTDLAWDHPAVQEAARRAAIRALRQQAQALLPRRLSELAVQHTLSYRSVAIKQLQTRWGSCDQSRNIALNLFLMQLPWELIDYVLLHELTHTLVMQHGPRFWQTMEQFAPDTQRLRAAIKQYRTVIT